MNIETEPERVKNILRSLTPDEVYAAAAVGCHRRITSIFHRQKGQHYVSEQNTEFSTEIESCCAEMVFAKFKNCYWSGAQWDGKVARFDVGNAQIRHTVHAKGHLILYDAEDDPEHRFVLVTGRCPNYCLVGWIFAHEGMKPEFWNQKALKPAWFVPQDVLHGFLSMTRTSP